MFFGDLFRASPYQMDETLFDEIPTSVLEDDNISFCAIPSQEEIWHAIKHMNSASLTGNDSFTCYFYLACWDIIKADSLVDEVHAGFVKERSILTHIVLARGILRDLNHESTGGNVVFKLDMTKAHNRL